MREIGKWSYTKVIGVLEKKLAINAICAFADLQAFHDVLVDKPPPLFCYQNFGKRVAAYILLFAVHRNSKF